VHDDHVHGVQSGLEFLRLDLGLEVPPDSVSTALVVVLVPLDLVFGFLRLDLGLKK